MAMGTFVRIVIFGLVLMGPSGLEAKTKKIEHPMADAALLSLLDIHNKEEVLRGENAQSHELSDDVQQFAAHMEKDDKKADLQVRALAGRLFIKLSTATPNAALSPDEETVSNTAFEKSFVEASAESHAELLKILEHQRLLLSKDSPVYDLVRCLLPTVRRHYEEASSLENPPGAAACAD